MAPRKRAEEKPIPLMIRLPPHLHALVQDTANRQHRSLNAQIIHIVSFYFGGVEDGPSSLADRPDYK